MKNLKSKYEQFSMTPSENSWEKLEQKLDKKPTAIFPILWKSVAVVLLVLGLSILWNQEEKYTKEILAEQVFPKIENEARVLAKVKEEKIENEPQVKKESHLPIVESLQLERKEHIAVKKQEKTSEKLTEKTAEKIENANVIKVEKNIETPQIAQNEKYTTAEELLFGVEVQRISNEQGKTTKKIGKINLPEIDVEPNRVEVLGIKIYEKSAE